MNPNVQSANDAARPCGRMPKEWQRAQRTVQMYAVYQRSASDEVLAGEEPLLYVDGATRDRWVADGSARSVRRGKALRLMINLPPRVQRSLSMGPGVIEGNAAGKRFAAALTAAWRPSFVVSAGVA